MENATTVSAINGSSEEDVKQITTEVIDYITFAIGALGLVGNTFVVVVIFSGRSMRQQLTNRYIINQSVIDAMGSLLLILTTRFRDNSRVFDSFLDELYCRLWLTKVLLWGMFFSSTYNLLALTFERYLAVVHPIWHRTKLTKPMVVGSMVFIWIFGPLYNISHTATTAYITDDGRCIMYPLWPDQMLQHGVGVFTICLQFIGPLIVLTFLYAKMIIVLRRKVAPEPAAAGGASAGGGGGGGATGGPERKTDTMSNARKNILKTLFIVGTCFTICWISNQVFYLLYNLGLQSINYSNAFYNFTVLMVFLNCCINPFIYLIKYEEFKKTARKLFFSKTISLNRASTMTSSAF